MSRRFIQGSIGWNEQAVRAVSRVAQDGHDHERAARHSRDLFIESPPAHPTAVVVVAKGAPRLPRLGFPPWTPPSEAPPPDKESPGGETHPPTRFISGALRAPSAWGPWGRISRPTGPGAP